jgi:hypothetical protein
LTQQGLTDPEIRDVVFHEDAHSGYSPSLLAEEDIRELATTNIGNNETFMIEDDNFHAMQEVVVPSTSEDRDTNATSTSDLEHIPPD